MARALGVRPGVLGRLREKAMSLLLSSGVREPQRDPHRGGPIWATPGTLQTYEEKWISQEQDPCACSVNSDACWQARCALRAPMTPHIRV